MVCETSASVYEDVYMHGSMLHACGIVQMCIVKLHCLTWMVELAPQDFYVIS